MWHAELFYRKEYALHSVLYINALQDDFKINITQAMHTLSLSASF